MDCDQLAVDHLHLAAVIVRRVTRRRDDDLEQEAALALVQAARSYDPDRGVTFTSWAWVRVQGAVIDAVNRRDQRHRVHQLHTVSYDHHWREPSVPSQENAAVASATVAELRRRLPARDVDMIDRYLAGQSWTEIAAVYGLTPSAISVALRRVRRHLAA